MKSNGGKDCAKPFPFAILWTHSPASSKLGASPLRQSRRSRLISSHKIAQTLTMFCCSSFPPLLISFLFVPTGNRDSFFYFLLISSFCV